jgi:integrative and conjugative element protein (TIGR02256 family)
MQRFCSVILLGGRRIVTIADEVMQNIQSFVAADWAPKEAGGIFLGCYRGPHVEVVACTVPLSKDKRSMFGFLRRDPGHSAAAIAAWKASGRTTTFVGEWHTHPEDNPTPSQVDRNTWLDLMRSRKSDPLIFLIAGRKTVYCDLGLENRLRRLEIVENKS